MYQIAFDVAMDLFETSRDWPREERYALTDQVRRSSRSVCANIAEAWAKRLYPRHFVSKLSDAHGEASETTVWIDFAERCGYLSAGEAEPLAKRCRHVAGALVTMMHQTERWCGPATTLREPDSPYGLDG